MIAHVWGGIEREKATGTDYLKGSVMFGGDAPYPGSRDRKAENLILPVGLPIATEGKPEPI